jgi:hypothetical protein
MYLRDGGQCRVMCELPPLCCGSNDYCSAPNGEKHKTNDATARQAGG